MSGHLIRQIMCSFGLGICKRPDIDREFDIGPGYKIQQEMKKKRN